MIHYWPAVLRLAIAVGTLIALPVLSGIGSRQDLPFNVVGILSLYPIVYGGYAFYLTFRKKLIPPFKFHFVDVVTGIGPDGRSLVTISSMPMYFLNWALPIGLRMLMGLLWPILDVLLQISFLVSALLLKLRTGELLEERAGSWNVSGRALILMLLVASAGLLIWSKTRGTSTSVVEATDPLQAISTTTLSTTTSLFPRAESVAKSHQPVTPSAAAEPPRTGSATGTRSERQVWTGKVQLMRQNRRTGAPERLPDWADITLRIPESAAQFEGDVLFPTTGVVAHLRGTQTEAGMDFVMDSLISGPAAAVSVPSTFTGRFDKAGVLRGSWNAGNLRGKEKESAAFWARPENAKGK